MHRISVKDFPGLDLGDVRRNERFVTIVEAISRQPGSSIPKQADSWYEAKAAYNFFSNKSVSLQALQAVIQAYGVNGVKQAAKVGDLLIVHDTSNISFGELQAEGLGYLDSPLGRGILCHSSIAVSTEGLPLSLLRQHTWVRPLEKLQSKPHKSASHFEDRESYRWCQGIKDVNEALGTAVRRIHIADREADIYERFFLAYEPGTELLIRAHYNRRLQNGSSLWQHLGEGEAKGEIHLVLPDERGRKKNNIKAEVRYAPVEILRPLRSKAAYQSVELTAIEVKQSSSDGEESLHWQLLTTLEVADVEDVINYIRWYSYRWLIERFHYVLKRGTRIEQLQLKKASSLQKAIALYSLAGFRIMQMVYQSRSHPQAGCEVVLTPTQWRVLYLLTHKGKALPQTAPSLSEAVKWMARLGGHLGRKSDGPPGLKTTWLGYQRLLDAADVYEQLTKQNLGKA